MKKTVGLLVVHGIGNQSAGTLSQTIAEALDQSSQPIHRNPVSAEPDQSNAPSSPPLTADNAAHPVVTLQADHLELKICEAHWADLSDPDNPPELRLVPDLLKDFFQTVSAAWHNLFLRVVLPGHTPVAKQSALLSFFMMGFLALCLTVVLLRKPYDGTQVVTDFNNSLFDVVGISMLILLVYYLWHFVRHVRGWLRAQITTSTPFYFHLLMSVGTVLILVVGYAWFFSALVLITIASEMLVVMLPVVIIVIGINYVFWIPVFLMRTLGAAARRLTLTRTALWLYRFGWIWFVLPVQTLLQATRAFSNMVSIVFNPHGFKARITAFVGGIGIYFMWLVLTVLCYFFLLPALLLGMIFWEPVADPGTLFITALLLFALYLGILKLSLPIIDLLLDISNYHLASEAERARYGDRLTRAMATLQAAGCNEYYLLAHSLGTVITYDWLHTPVSTRYPIRGVITLGSPLDKFWYIDHAYARRVEDEQGVTGHSDLRWVNYYAWSDPVSAWLAHFRTRRHGLVNVRLRWLGVYLYSHIRYWRNAMVLADLYRYLQASDQTESSTPP